ncbi:MAG: geranylgeranylglyceryl/heptaprenylglyceryl phosphate synthase [Candidatus Hodarchaeota archaeon]
MPKLAILIDSGKGKATERIHQALIELAKTTQGQDYLEIWVGSSQEMGGEIRKYLKQLHEQKLGLPVRIFPGNPLQVSAHADYLLVPSPLNITRRKIKIAVFIGKRFIQLSRISAFIRRRKFPKTLPFGYLVLGPGTSVGRKLGARSLDDDRAFKLIENYIQKNSPWGVYIEAGSGAKQSVANRDQLIQRTSELTKENITLCCGGGIRTHEEIETILKAGADIVVVSTVLEKTEDPKTLMEQYLEVYS